MLARELGTLWQLFRGIPAAGSHAERLQGFYAPQAAHYDRFRERLLQGRAALIEHLDLLPGASVIELGAGTGRNLEYFSALIPTLADVELVDLCPAPLEQARRRAARWPNVRVVEADASRHSPASPVDRVYFSYSLTMIPDWAATLENAIAMLRPGGLLGIVDFYIADRARPTDQGRYGPWTRFWPWWFRHDGVRLSAQHLPYLQARLCTQYLYEGFASIPYLPGVRAPYYIFVGRKA